MDGATAITAVAFFGGIAVVLRPVAAALARRISGEPRRKALEPEERDQLLSELHAVRQEVAELAERMDFAERLLAKPRGG